MGEAAGGLGGDDVENGAGADVLDVADAVLAVGLGGVVEVVEGKRGGVAVVVVSIPCRIHGGHTRLIDVLVQDVGVVLGPAVLVQSIFGAVVECIADVLVQVEHPEQAFRQGVGVLVHPEVRSFARRVGVEAVFAVGEGRGPLEAADLVEVPVARGQLFHDKLRTRAGDVTGCVQRGEWVEVAGGLKSTAPRDARSPWGTAHGELSA